MRRLLLTCSLFALAPACAQGGGDGDEDAGRVRFDSGRPMEDDAGRLPGLDAGMMVETDGGQIPEDDAGMMMMFDAGPRPDSGITMIDAGPDAGPPGCTSAAECNDGLVCNGIERCNAGVCGPGTPPTCDDSIACTMNRCIEPTSGTTPECDYVPLDAMCPSGQSCNPATGCVAGCAESPCRLVNPQCGCPSGQGCYLNGANRTCAAVGAAGEGTTCTSINSCQPGLICLDLNPTATTTNACGRFCATDANCVGEGSLCIYTLDDGMGGAVPGVTVCSRSCNPMTSAGCVSGSSCQIFQETAAPMRLFTDCLAPVGTGGRDAPCADSTGCQRGFICLNPDGFGNRCVRYCQDFLDCAFDQDCYGPFEVGGSTYGYCDFF
jgi:hypothetical protein